MARLAVTRRQVTTHPTDRVGISCRGEVLCPPRVERSGAVSGSVSESGIRPRIAEMGNGRWGQHVTSDFLPRRSGPKFPDYVKMFLMALAYGNAKGLLDLSS